MLFDITLCVTPEIRESAPEKADKALTGHLGTHFDVMDKTFPLEYTRRKGIIFDVSKIRDRDIDITDINVEKVKKDQFVAFYTGYIDEVPYGSVEYFKGHPQLSHQLIDALLERKISIIGIDCSGIRRSREHTPADQLCADHNVFVVENLCNLGALVSMGQDFIAHTYPINHLGITGLPCRVVAEV